MNTLDTDISSAFALLAVLLVFVIGYFAAFFPLVQGLLDQPTPEVDADRKTMISQLRTYRVLLGGVILLAILTGVVLAPLTRRVAVSISFRGPFPTVEAGLLLIDLMLLALFAVTVWVLVRIGYRIRTIRHANDNALLAPQLPVDPELVEGWSTVKLVKIERKARPTSTRKASRVAMPLAIISSEKIQSSVKLTNMAERLP